MLSATGLSSKLVAPVFGSRGTARKTFGGGKFVVKATQQRHQNERRQEDQRASEQAAKVVGAASLLAAFPAQADTADLSAPAASGPALVDSTVGTLIDVVKAAGSAVKTGLDYVGVGLSYAKNAYNQAAPVVKDVTDTAAPYVKKGLETANEVAAPVVRAAEPVVKAGVGEVESFLAKQGLNASVFVDGAKKASDSASDALTSAKPTLDSTVSTLSSTNPVVIGEYVLGLLAIYYLGPGIVKGIFGSFRGYAGNISAAGALDAISNDGNTLLIDIRSDKEKESSGVPDVPNSGRVVELEYASISDRKIRGQLRNPSDIEKTVTVLSIAALKKVSKGTKILLLDRNGGQSKAVAKELAKKGFKKVFVVSNGFSGWTSSKLQTKFSSSVSSVEVLSPIFGTQRSSTQRGTTQRGTKQTGRLSLPSGR
ncbi:hypothetical protein WJX75_009385 [Coccomyxa subellipsoidea]|uniref:Rhodanese domain-containing protein n=1 Tax=Coccomyxa subellipsoidea TaxID=248742 RepID=A0ABR2YQG6_9CHLO